MTNSTFTDNGLAAIRTTGALTIKNSTISDNGAGIEAYSNTSTGHNTSTLSIENTILADNGGGEDCEKHDAIILSFINNLIEFGNMRHSHYLS